MSDALPAYASAEAAAVATYPPEDVGVDRVHYSDDGAWAGVYLIVNGWYQMFAQCLRNEAGQWTVIAEQSGHPSEELLRIPSATDVELQGARVLKRATIGAEVSPTGATRHVVGGMKIGPAAALVIARYEGADGFYLFHLDEAGKVVTDTWHESIDAALDQAQFEYEGLSWTDVHRL